MAVISNVVGGTTATGAVVVVRVDSGADVRVRAATSEEGDPMWFGPVTPAEPVPGHWVARVDLGGLEPDTHYWWRSEHDGVLDEDYPGELDTHPVAGAPASYTVAVIGDAGLTPTAPGINGARFPTRMSNHEAFLTVAGHALDPLMVCHLGDMHYYNPGDPNWAGADLEDYLGAWDDVLAQPNQHALYRRRALQYMWDDHDYGPNDSDGNHDGKQHAAAAYRLRAPHHTLERADGAIYHAFHIGRVLYISSDTRYDRTPNREPDNSNKTYLGWAQKTWLLNLMRHTTAEAIVWLMPNPWLGTLDDTWGGFTTERDQIAAVIEETGWSDRMVMVAADVHAIGHWSGTANRWGRFAGMLCASIDATPSAAGGGQYDRGFRGGRDQYGTVSIDDDGSTITITMTAWIGDEVWGTQSITIDAPYDPPGPGPDPGPQPLPPTPPAVAEARIETSVHWLAINDRTGRIIADLPDTTGRVSRLLMAYTSQQLTLPLASLPIEVIEQATEPQQASIVQVVNGVPAWAGRVLAQVGGSGPDLKLATATPEQYLLQRRVTTQSFEAADRTEVALALLSDAGSTDIGAGMGLEVDAEPTGDLVDRRYLASDQTTVYAALRELAEAGTLEWTIDLDFADASETVVRRIIRLRHRIGQHPEHPVAFETGTPAGVEYTLSRDFSTGRYANHVTVYGDGEGDDMPRSDPAIDLVSLDAGAPIVEAVMHVRDATTHEERNRIARAELARLMHGVELWELTSALHEYPRLAYDVGLGDRIGWNLRGPRHPYGVEGTGRVIGWGVDAARSVWEPQLLDPHEEVAL